MSRNNTWAMSSTCDALSGAIRGVYKGSVYKECSETRHRYRLYQARSPSGASFGSTCGLDRHEGSGAHPEQCGNVKLSRGGFQAVAPAGLASLRALRVSATSPITMIAVPPRIISLSGGFTHNFGVIDPYSSAYPGKSISVHALHKRASIYTSADLAPIASPSLSFPPPIGRFRHIIGL